MNKYLPLISCLLVLTSSLSYSQELDPYEAGWKGKKMCEFQHEDKSVRILLCTFPPDEGHERHSHGPAYNYAIEGGTLRIMSENGEQEIAIPTGAGVYSDEVKWHEVVNVGTTTVKVLLIESKK
jgi:quercetin dioxygenase-like cupin family protein